MKSTDVEVSSSSNNTLSSTPGSDEPNPFDNATIRRHFISKVFGILTAMLTVTFSIMAVFIFVNSAKEWMLKYGKEVSITASGVYLFISFVLICYSSSVGRRVPCNYIILFIFTLSTAFMFTPIVILYDLEAIFLSLGITLVLVVTVTFLSACTSFDFTRWLCVFNLILFGFFLTFVAIYLVSIFTGGPAKWMVMALASVGVVVFTLGLAIEVQLIVGGRRVSYSPEDYVLATINIYLDIIYIFIYLLQIFGRTGRS